MNGTDYYLRIQGLRVPQNTPKNLENSINQFIDTIERCAEQLDDSLAANNMADFTTRLEKIQGILKAVYAEKLHADGEKLLLAAKKNDTASCRRDVKPFIINLKTLSIDMQRAQFFTEEQLVNTRRATSRGSGPLKTVLAVDDMPDILTTVNAALAGHYTMLGAPSASVALQIIKKQKIDMFILDIDMPGMNGFELTKEIRAVEGYADTPIMFLTGKVSRERIKRSMQLNIKDFIVKPAYNETLLAKVDSHLG